MNVCNLNSAKKPIVWTGIVVGGLAFAVGIIALVGLLTNTRLSTVSDFLKRPGVIALVTTSGAVTAVAIAGLLFQFVKDRSKTIELANRILPVLERDNITAKRKKRGKIVTAIAALPENERAPVVDLALRAAGVGFFNTREDKIELIQAIAAVSANERTLVVDLALRVTPDVSSSNEIMYRILIIKAIAALTKNEREEIVEHVLRLSPGEARGATRYFNNLKLIEALAAVVPANARADIVRDALRLITPLCAYDDDNIEIIQALAAVVPADARTLVVDLALQVTVASRDSRGSGKLIQAIAAVSANERALVIDLALRVANASLDSRVEGQLIQAIAVLPAVDRAEIVRIALRLITHQMYIYDKIAMIQLVAALPANERDAYVRDRLRGIHRDINPVVAAAHGTNVHEGSRDQHTQAAIQLLYDKQGALSRVAIEQATQEFIEYLGAPSIDSVQKQLAQDALLKPRGRGETFGPLIDEEGFSIQGLQILGEELIGRLWIFASQLAGDEQTNAKIGMISALMDSYSSGVRVCNQGKIQRLVVAVLQGRLSGVDMEGIMIPAQVSTAVAIPLFFQVVDHCVIRVLNDLNAAANLFCDLNPTVNRVDFLVEIAAYAALQDIV